jgi:hypothetical protein
MHLKNWKLALVCFLLLSPALDTYFGSYGFVCGGGVNCEHFRVEVVSNYLWYSPLRADGIMLKEILFRIATFYH